MKSKIVSSRDRIAELDGLRGTAVIMVLIWHYINGQNASQISASFRYLNATTNIFWSGVDLFFVLSGFLIGGILLDNRLSLHNLTVFYIRRSARILPLYFALLATSAFVASIEPFASSSWLFNESIPSWTYFVFSQNIYMGLRESSGGNFLASTWSLAVEEQFYIALPILFLLARPRYLVGILLVVLLLASSLRILSPGFHATVNTPFRMDSLLIGVLAAQLFRTPTFLEFLDNNKKLFPFVTVGFATTFAAMTISKTGRQSFEPLVIASFYAFVLSIVVSFRNEPITRVLRGKTLLFFGRYYYGIYLVHQPLAGMIHEQCLGASPDITTLVGFTCTLASLVLSLFLSVCCYHLFEKRFLNIGQRYKYK